MQWVASTLHTTSEHGVSSVTTATTADPSADLNGLVRCAEGTNLVSAHVPSRFKRAIPNLDGVGELRHSSTYS
jgi:hypothetical protein